MTQFDKSKFNYHGGYLMYRGDYEGRPVYPDGPNVHPTMVGRGVDLFIARFKHRGAPITKSQFICIKKAQHQARRCASCGGV